MQHHFQVLCIGCILIINLMCALNIVLLCYKRQILCYIKGRQHTQYIHGTYEVIFSSCIPDLIYRTRLRSILPNANEGLENRATIFGAKYAKETQREREDYVFHRPKCAVPRENGNGFRGKFRPESACLFIARQQSAEKVHCLSTVD